MLAPAPSKGELWNIAAASWPEVLHTIPRARAGGVSGRREDGCRHSRLGMAMAVLHTLLFLWKHFSVGKTLPQSHQGRGADLVLALSGSHASHGNEGQNLL